MYEVAPKMDGDVSQQPKGTWVNFPEISQSIQAEITQAIEKNDLEEKIRTNIEKNGGTYL